MKKRTIAISVMGIVALFAVLAATPTASAVATLHFVPQDISVPEGYCNTRNVEVRINLSAGQELDFGQFGFSYEPLCGNITSRTLNTDIMTGVDPSWSSWNSPWLEDDCWNDTRDWIVFDFWIAKTGPADLLVGNFTIHCNSTEYCANDLNFGAMWPGCSQGWILMWDVVGNPVPTSTINGTFECGVAAPAETFTKSLAKGWNLISLPLTPLNNSTSAVLGNDTMDYDAVYRYNATSKQFEDITTGTMDPGIGYFVNVTTEGTWTYKGTPYKEMNIPLKEGLNMVGWLNCSMNITDTNLDNSSLVYYGASFNVTTQKFETFNPVAPDIFNDFDKMERGTGYFISAKADDTLEENCL